MDLRRFVALLVVWTGLIGAGLPAAACAAAAAAGDCCPPGAPSGCTQAYEQLDAAATVCCITAAAPSAIASIERGRDLQAVQADHGSADPIAIVALSSAPFADLRPSRVFHLLTDTSTRTDSSLTYLHTGRLRL